MGWRGADDIVNGCPLCPEEIGFYKILRRLAKWQGSSQALCSLSDPPPNLPSFNCLPVLYGTSNSNGSGCTWLLYWLIFSYSPRSNMQLSEIAVFLSESLVYGLSVVDELYLCY